MAQWGIWLMRIFRIFVLLYGELITGSTGGDGRGGMLASFFSLLQVTFGGSINHLVPRNWFREVYFLAFLACFKLRPERQVRGIYFGIFRLLRVTFLVRTAIKLSFETGRVPWGFICWHF